MTQDRPFRANPLTACLVGVALLGLSACSTLAPAPLSQGDIDLVNQADWETARKDVQPVTGPLTLDEAMARALKYNLDRRVRLLEEAMALRQLDVILTIIILGVDDGLSVSTVTVNEGSPYAVFTVTGTPGQATYLSLDNEQTTGLERLEYHDPNSTDANANGWVLYTSGTVNLDANGELLVRVAIDPEQEAMLDSPETFRLIATNVNGIESAFDAGIGTILDDGTGDYFADDNTDGVSVVPEGVTLDDDSPGMTIVPVTVEEGSTAVFNVKVTAAEAPYTVTFATSLSSQSAEADDIGALVVKDSTGHRRQDHLAGRCEPLLCLGAHHR